VLCVLLFLVINLFEFGKTKETRRAFEFFVLLSTTHHHHHHTTITITIAIAHSSLSHVPCPKSQVLESGTVWLLLAQLVPETNFWLRWLIDDQSQLNNSYAPKNHSLPKKIVELLDRKVGTTFFLNYQDL